MKKIFVALLALVIGQVALAQTKVYTKQFSDNALRKEARRWVKDGAWRP